MKKKNFEAVQKKLISLMETEGSNWTKSWVGTSRPTNFMTKKPYRGLNNFWLSMQGYTSSEWGTWKQWTDKGYKVKDDQKKAYTDIFFSQMREKKEEWLSESELARYKATGKLPKYWMWKKYFVYNADQIENYTSEVVACEPRTELTDDETLYINNWVANTKAVINHGGGSAFYAPLKDQITMPNKEAFFSDVDYFSTLLHELTHWTGHESRCDRGLSMDKEDYAAEELVAEIGSAMLCNELQIEKTVRPDHAQYLNNWIAAITKDEKAMITAFSKAQKAIDVLEKLQEIKTERAA